MDEYIDKNALVKSFDEKIKSVEIWRDDCKGLGTTTEYADRAFVDFNESRLRVKNFPTVDAVKVVRCRDCKYWTRTVGDDQWSLGDCSLFDKHLVMCNGFCAWAERRTDERFNKQTGGTRNGRFWSRVQKDTKRLSFKISNTRKLCLRYLSRMRGKVGV